MAESPSARLVSVECDGPVATIVVDNPPANAMSEALIVELRGAFAGVDADPGVRAVVLASRGPRAFLAGADFSELRKMAESPELVAEHTHLTRSLLDQMQAQRVPVVAAVAAAAVGGGLEVLLVCDLVIAEQGVRFGFPEVRLGLIPGAGGTQRLARRIGAARAAELILSGEIFEADRAADLGLVSRVVSTGEALAAAQQLASELSELPARAVQAAKRVIGVGAQLPLAEGLELERQAFGQLFATSDAREGIDAFLAKRAPRFTHS